MKKFAVTVYHKWIALSSPLDRLVLNVTASMIWASNKALRGLGGWAQKAVAEPIAFGTHSLAIATALLASASYR
jgi:hypothetical protein